MCASRSATFQSGHEGTDASTPARSAALVSASASARIAPKKSSSPDDMVRRLGVHRLLGNWRHQLGAVVVGLVHERTNWPELERVVGRGHEESRKRVEI